MKKLVLFSIGLALTVCQTAVAQNKLKEGKVKFEISYPEADDMSDQMLAMMPKESTVFIKDGKSRIEMKMAMGSVVILTDGKTNETISLSDIMGKKSAIKFSAEEAEQEKAKRGEYDVKLTGETKKIAGYECKKAIITFKEEDKDPMDVWFTEDIESAGSRFSYDGINGMMLEYTREQKNAMGTIVMNFTATKIEKIPVEADMFKVPEGYTVTTMEEMMKNAK